MKYESTILKRLIDTYGVVGNPRYISEIIKEFIVRGKERFPELFTYQADWLAHIDEFGLNPSYTVSYTGQSIYAPNTLERPVKSAILSGNTKLVDKFGYELDTIDNVSIITTKGYMLNVSTGEQTEIATHKVTDFIYLKDSITKITFDGGATQRICFYNYDKTFISGDSASVNNTKTFNVPEGAKYFRISYNFSTELTTINDQNGTKVYDYNNDLQLVSVKMPLLTTSNEDGTKTNILSTTEEVVLRGIGDVKDTLDCLTGEVVQNIGEIVLDGSEGWNVSGYNNWTNCYTKKYVLPHLINKGTSLISDKMISYINYDYLGAKDVIGIAITKEGYVCLKYLPNGAKPKPSEVSAYLESNPITFQYPLENESIKTVDLTILDQNGQNVKQLMSFKGGTHFNTRSSEGSLLPLVSVSVETDLEETLKVCSLEGNTM